MSYIRNRNKPRASVENVLGPTSYSSEPIQSFRNPPGSALSSYLKTFRANPQQSSYITQPPPQVPYVYNSYSIAPQVPMQYIQPPPRIPMQYIQPPRVPYSYTSPQEYQDTSYTLIAKPNRFVSTSKPPQVPRQPQVASYNTSYGIASKPPQVPQVYQVTQAPQVTQLSQAPQLTQAPQAPSTKSDTTPTYIYMSHGKDTLIPNPLSPGTFIPNRNETIPAGCTYETIAEAGRPADMKTTYVLSKIINNPESKPYLFKPLKYFNILTKLLKEKGIFGIIKVEKRKFHVSKEGDNYSETHCNFLLGFKEKKSNIASNEVWRVFKSGMYDISIPYNFIFPESWDESYLIGPDGVTEDVIRKIYGGSLFPTADEVIAKLKYYYSHTKKYTYTYLQLSVAVYAVLKDDKKYETQKQLFEWFPGHHYNFSCRSFDDDKIVNNTTLKLVRNQSSRVCNRRRENCSLGRYNSIRRTRKGGKSIKKSLKCK